MTDIEPVLVAPGALGGTRWVYRFPNGWGASVIRGAGTYGTELCVTRPVSEDPDAFYLVEDPLNEGWLSPEQITDRLIVIAARPWAGPPDLAQRWQPAPTVDTGSASPMHLIVDKTGR